MIYPVKNFIISQHFGESPADYSAWGLKGHNGLDLCTFWKDTIMASHDGEVIKVVNDPYHTLGKNVWIYGTQYTTVYAHLENVCVSVGDRVIQGQKIGEMGNTGNVRGATGIHLHFGVYKFVPAIPNTYQVNYNGKAYTILNHDNGYGGALDFETILNMLQIIGTKNDNRQYIVGSDGVYHWIFGQPGQDSATLIALHNMGVVNKNEVTWVDSINSNLIGEPIALLK